MSGVETYWIVDSPQQGQNYVAPAVRGSGHGTQMMRWAVARCRERGCGMVSLTSNKRRPNAHRFYLALGFAQSHEGFRLML